MDSASRGFTLTELIVVVGIIGIVSTTVISSQSNYNKQLGLTNVAYDVALTLRSVQTYGLGSRVVGVSSNAPHGLYFEKSSPASFIHFADTYPAPSSSTPDARPGNALYDAAQNEQVLAYTLGNGVTISNFCARGSTGPWRCAYQTPGAMGLEHSTLSIVFSRPNADPAMRIDSITAVEACLTVTSPQGGERYISVAPSGQIRAKAPDCPL